MEGSQGTGTATGPPTNARPRQEQMILDLYRQGVRNANELAESYGVSRSTIYRLLDRSDVAPMLPGQVSTGERHALRSRQCGGDVGRTSDPGGGVQKATDDCRSQLSPALTTAPDLDRLPVEIVKSGGDPT